MRHSQNSHAQSLVVVALSTLAIVIAFGALGRNAVDLTAQAFQSPVETPTPSPSPTPPYGPSNEALRALAHVATRYGLPPEHLSVVNEHRRDYPLLRRSFRAATIHDRGGTGFYQLLVDLADRRIEEDVPAIERAATLALRARYGRLHPTLYARLQKIGDDEELSVAIWSEARPMRSQAQRYTEVARRFPEAAAALARSGVPFDVANSALAERIRDAYTQMLVEDTEAQLRPLVQYLQSRGIPVQVVDGVPTVAARLSKRLILALNHRTDVAMIFLIEEPIQAVMDVANQTTLVTQVRSVRGLTGAGQRIAILEPGNIVPTAQCLPGWRIAWVRVAGSDSTGHKTRVANVAVCDDTRFGGAYTGVAPAATIIDAGVSDTDHVDALRALKFATDPDRHAHVVNISAMWGQSRSVEWIDKAFDWLARQRSVVLVAAVGNRQPPNNSLNVGTPAKGWNVLAVGAFDDHNTPSWHDDTMWVDSAYLNPLYYAATHYDREKPELVAPGVNITTINTDGSTFSGPGTSLAAPQIAGMAALLMERDPALQQAAEAVRAILMASAVHNIEGDPSIPSGQELRDGAGSVNAILADTIAQTHWTSDISPCPGSCWYQVAINPNYPSPQGPLQRYFSAKAGNLIRVAISWWSYADADEGSYPIGIDQLLTNLDLEIRDPDGQAVESGYSASWDNNYEIVHFIAPKTGNYTIRVLRGSTGYNEDNTLGIAVAQIYRTMLPIILNDN